MTDILAGYDPEKVKKLADRFQVSLEELAESKPLLYAVKKCLDDDAFISCLKERLALRSKVPRWTDPTPAQSAAMRFHLEDELGTDPRVAKLLDYKVRLDESVSRSSSREERAAARKIKFKPEGKARMIAKVRAAYGFDGPQPYRIETLIESVANTLLFIAYLRKQKAAGGTNEPNRPAVTATLLTTTQKE